jgi:hypothetical protein
MSPDRAVRMRSTPISTAYKPLSHPRSTLIFNRNHVFWQSKIPQESSHHDGHGGEGYETAEEQAGKAAEASEAESFT